MIEQTNPERSEITLPRILRAPSGWVLEDLCRLDALHPGFLRRATEARPAWRHAVALAIANGLFDHADRFLARCVPDDLSALSWPEILTRTAAAIMEMKPAEIVEASFGSCPDGLAGSLSKLGFDPNLDREALLALHAVFADPQHTRRRKVIEQLKVLDQGLFEAAMITDLALITPKTIGRLRHGRAAEAFNSAVAILRRHVSTATDTALAKSLADIGPETSVRDWARTWLARADVNLPSPPWLGGDGLILLRNGELLATAGRRTKTCIETRINLVVAGQAAYYLEPEAGVIACVIRTEKDWLACQVIGFRNGRVPKPVRDRVLGILERNGVPVFRPIEDVDGIAFAVGGYLHGRLDEFDLTHLMDEIEAH